MKKLIVLLCLIYFMCDPLPIAQAQTDSSTVNKAKENILKQKIANNIDSIKSIAIEKINSKPTVVIHKKYYRHVERDTVYIDTCLNKPRIKYIFQQVEPPDTAITRDEPEVKIKWYQKIFKKHRKK